MNKQKASDLREFASAPEDVMKDACECAYNQLSDAEKEVLSRQISVLVEIHGMGRKSALELLAKVGLWLNENKPQAYPSDEGGFREFGLKKEDIFAQMRGYRKSGQAVTIGLDYSENGPDKSCVCFATSDSLTGKIVVLGTSFDHDVIDLVHRKTVNPERWSDEDEEKLNQLIESY